MGAQTGPEPAGPVARAAAAGGSQPGADPRRRRERPARPSPAGPAAAAGADPTGGPPAGPLTQVAGDLVEPPGPAADPATAEIPPAGRGERPGDRQQPAGGRPPDGSPRLDGGPRLNGGPRLDGEPRLEGGPRLDGMQPVGDPELLDGVGPVGLGAADAALVEAAGMPPEVAAFLAETATAAGLELGPALRAAGVRSRRRSRTSPDRVQRSFYLSRDLVDRARAAVAATMDVPGEAYNVSQLAGRALENEVLRLERVYNNGNRFPPVSHVPSGPSPEGVERIRAGVTSPRQRRSR